MIVSVMQPYFFPYLGYYQLVAQSDLFIFLDDVNYINKGWINRNRVLVNGEPSFITVPLSGASQNRMINEIEVNYQEKWDEKMLRNIEMNYKKAPFFESAFPVIQSVVSAKQKSISQLCVLSISKVFDYLELNPNYSFSSILNPEKEKAGEERIISLVAQNKGNIYVNPEGGQELYHLEHFQNANLELKFIKMTPTAYKQIKAVDFIPYLSMIDVLMHVSSEEIRDKYLKDYVLIS